MPRRMKVNSATAGGRRHVHDGFVVLRILGTRNVAGHVGSVAGAGCLHLGIGVAGEHWNYRGSNSLRHPSG